MAQPDVLKEFAQEIQWLAHTEMPDHELLPKFLQSFADLITCVRTLQTLDETNRSIIDAQRRIIAAQHETILQLTERPNRLVRGTPPQRPQPAPESDTGLWALGESGSNGLQVHPH